MTHDRKLRAVAESVSFRDGFETVATGSDAVRLGHELLERALGPDLLQEVLTGRPPLGNVWRAKGHRSPMLTFRLPVELSDQFRDLVVNVGKPQSEVLREAVAEYVQRHST